MQHLETILNHTRLCCTIQCNIQDT